MFLRLQTQWNVAGMGSVVGLNYQSLEFVFGLYEVKDRKALFEDIRDIERGALKEMGKAREGKTGVVK